MDDTEGRRRIAVIQKPDSLEGLTTRAGNPDRQYHLKAKLSFEWGLAQDKSSTEVILIVGSGGSVDWKHFLADSIPLAHRHPWFKGESEERVLRGVKGFGKPGTVLLNDLLQGRAANVATAAVEQKVASGRVIKRAVAPVSVESVELSAGRMIVLPSAGDIRFTAKHNLERHTVFTPYLCLRMDGQDHVADPHQDVAPLLEQEGNENLGLLRFELIHPHQIKSSEDFGSSVDVYAGNERLWHGYAIARANYGDTDPPDLKTDS